MNRCLTASLSCGLALLALAACGGDNRGVPSPDMGSRCAARPTGDPRWAQYPAPGSAGHPRSYEVTSAGTVIDCVTGLEWERTADPGAFSQAQAIAHCEALELGGYTDWRLPSRIELVTLIDYSAASPGPTLDRTAFPGTPGGVFWSATPTADLSGNGWYVYFGNGYVGYEPTPDVRARCVR